MISSMFKNHSKAVIRKIENSLEVVKNFSRDKDDPESVISTLNEHIKSVLTKPISPIFERKKLFYNSVFRSSDIEKKDKEVDKDLDVITNEVANLYDNSIDDFNYLQIREESITKKANITKSKLEEYSDLSSSRDSNVMVVTDSFLDKDKIDKEYITSSKCNIFEQDGLLTLSLEEENEITDSASVAYKDGNGEQGRNRIVIESEEDLDDEIISSNLFNRDKEREAENIGEIITKDPGTVFEYQSINISDKTKSEFPYYDFSWASDINKLNLELVIDLQSTQEINWIDIRGFIPEDDDISSFTIEEVSTSEDGAQFTKINHEEIIIEEDYKSPPLLFRTSESSISRYKSLPTGNFHFEPRKSRYVKIILSRNEPYDTNLGIFDYTLYREYEDSVGKVTKTNKNIPENMVQTEIRESPPGRYPFGSNSYVKKELRLIDGQRYCIGLKDISVFRYKFKEKSQLITNRFTTEKPIRGVMLHTMEYIPPSFYKDISKRNEFIKYYISFGDGDWYRISPVHHRPVAGDPIPPNLYLINTNINNTDQSNYRSISIEDNNNIRLRIEMKRPDDEDDDELEYMTPILEGYSLQLILED